MIDLALELLRSSINDYFKRKFSNNSVEYISLSAIVDAEGILKIPAESLGITLINVEEERVNKDQKHIRAGDNGNYKNINPVISLNLYILVTANYTQYKTGLQFLSEVIKYFQSFNVFTTRNTPAMPPGLDKLIIELYTLNLEQQNHLWGSLGAKYLPSVLYKVRMLSIQEDLSTGEIQPISGLNIQDGKM